MPREPGHGAEHRRAGTNRLFTPAKRRGRQELLFPWDARLLYPAPCRDAVLLGHHLPCPRTPGTDGQAQRGVSTVQRQSKSPAAPQHQAGSAQGPPWGFLIPHGPGSHQTLLELLPRLLGGHDPARAVQRAPSHSSVLDSGYFRIISLQLSWPLPLGTGQAAPVAQHPGLRAGSLPGSGRAGRAGSSSVLGPAPAALGSPPSWPAPAKLICAYGISGTSSKSCPGSPAR